MNDINLKCPFCGLDFEIGISDDEGNVRDVEYLKDPYSGISYYLKHEDVGECLISSHEDEMIGRFLYSTKEELIEKISKRY